MKHMLLTLAASVVFTIGLALVPQPASACGGCGCQGGEKEKDKSGDCESGKSDCDKNKGDKSKKKSDKKAGK